MHKEMSENIDALRTLNKISSFMLMYADDTVLHANSETMLHTLCDNLSVYCNKWKIDVSTSKTKICIFERNKISL